METNTAQPPHAGEIIEFQLHHRSADNVCVPVHYGIDVSHVREIIKVPASTPLPEAHPSILGIFHLREHIIPLINLAHWLKAEAGSPAEEKRVIVTQFQEGFHGFLVDAVNRIYQVCPEHLESTASFQQKGQRESITSVIRMDDRLIMMLDFESIIRDTSP